MLRFTREDIRRRTMAKREHAPHEFIPGSLSRIAGTKAT